MNYRETYRQTFEHRIICRKILFQVYSLNFYVTYMLRMTNYINKNNKTLIRFEF